MRAATAGRLRVDVATDRETLARSRVAWVDLQQQGGPASPFGGPAWFEAYLDHKHPQDAPWLCALAHEGDQLVGVLALVTDRARRRALRVPGEYFTRDAPPTLAPGRELEAAEALAAAAFEHVPSARRISLGGLREDAPGFAALTRLPGATHWRDGEGGHLSIEGDVAALHQRIGKNMRRNLRKAANRIEREQAAPLRYEILRGVDADPQLLEQIASLEARGWKGREGGALGTTPANLTLYRDLARRWHAEDSLEWHRLLIGERIGAMHMAVRVGSTLTMLRIAYEEELSRYSPSGLLLLHFLEHAHTEGCLAEVDFVQEQDWQDRWHVEASRYRRFSICRPGLAATLTTLGPDRLNRRLRESPLLRRLARGLHLS